MAQGTFTLFEEFADYIGDGSHDLDADSFKLMLITNGVVPTAADATPDSGDYTEVTGTGYTAGGAAVTVTYTEVGGVATFACTNSPISWAKNAAGPTNIYYGILYNTSHAGTNDAIGFVDMTADGGTTPVSLQNGAINVTIGTIFTTTVS